ncbi:hypothetical protein M514_05059, partial [Trichuris suis]
ETGLTWKALQKKSLVTGREECSLGYKARRKLESKETWTFQNITYLSVVYSEEKNTWMHTEILEIGFKKNLHLM